MGTVVSGGCDSFCLALACGRLRTGREVGSRLPVARRLMRATRCVPGLRPVPTSAPHRVVRATAGRRAAQSRLIPLRLSLQLVLGNHCRARTAPYHVSPYSLEDRRVVPHTA